MRVCLLAPELLPNRGGVGAYCTELLRSLSDEVEFTVLTLQRFESGRTLDAAQLREVFGPRVDLRVIAEARDGFLYNAGFQRAVVRALRALAAETEIDLIHSQHAHMPDLWSGLVRSDPPTIRTVHTTIAGQREGIRVAAALGVPPEPSERWQIALAPVLSAAERLTLAREEPVVTVSDWMRRTLEASGMDPARIEVIPSAVDARRFVPVRRDPDAADASPGLRVLYSGRPTAVKGANVLARAMPKILERFPHTEFVFTGGRAEEFLPLLAHPGRVAPQLRFLGYLPFDALPQVYSSADVVVVPSIYENLPARLLEAMACGAAVVASDVCGIPEAITSGTDGLLVPPNSSDALADAVLRLLADEGERRTLGRAARTTIEARFDWKVTSRAIARAYRGAIDGADGRAASRS